MDENTKVIWQYDKEKVEFPFFSLCDNVLYKISKNETGITLLFNSGSFVQDCSNSLSAVYISDCDWDDMWCEYVQRYSPFHKSIFWGKEISVDIINKLNEKGKRLVIMDEHWACSELYLIFHVTPTIHRHCPQIHLRIPLDDDSKVVFYSY